MTQFAVPSVVRGRFAQLPDPQSLAVLGEQTALSPAGDAAIRAKAIVVATLRRWHEARAWDDDLIAAAERVDVELLDALMTAGVWANRGAFASRLWTRLERSRRLVACDGGYWLVLGRLRWELRPRWVTEKRLAWGIDRRMPILFRMRLVEPEQSSLQLRLEVVDGRAPQDLNESVLAEDMAWLAQSCLDCGHGLSEPSAGRTTWATVELRKPASPPPDVRSKSKLVLTHDFSSQSRTDNREVGT